MHDPKTVAFEIRYPWKAYRNPRNDFERGYRRSFVTIWHVDPEADGSDDSCDWFGGRKGRSERAEKLLDELVSWELGHQYFTAASLASTEVEGYGLRQVSPGDAFALVTTAMRTIAWRLDQRSMDSALLAECARLACNEHDNFRGSFIVYPEDYGGSRENQIRNMFSSLLGCYLRFRRPWYKHPRWHIRHWKVQVHFIQAFKRWAFSRCCRCGGRFAWEESPCTNSWDSTGPRWFRGESQVYHSRCSSLKVAADAS